MLKRFALRIFFHLCFLDEVVVVVVVLLVGSKEIRFNSAEGAKEIFRIILEIKNWFIKMRLGHRQLVSTWLYQFDSTWWSLGLIDATVRCKLEGQAIY